MLKKYLINTAYQCLIILPTNAQVILPLGEQCLRIPGGVAGVVLNECLMKNVES